MEELTAMSKLYVLTVYKNLRGLSPQSVFMYRNYSNFATHMSNAGVKLLTAEIDIGAGFDVTGSRDLQLHASCPELFNNKDRALNLLIEKLPVDAEYVAWMDSDIHFCNPFWVRDTIQLLKIHPVVQMFTYTQDLDEFYNPIGEIGISWAHRYKHRTFGWDTGAYSGVGWAFRREIIDKLPFMDKVISGQADTEAALAFVGLRRNNDHLDWATQAYSLVKGNIGCLSGLVLHHWHGPRQARDYAGVNSILTDCKYDPDKDIELDNGGLYKFTGNNPKLETAIHEWYNKREGINV